MEKMQELYSVTKQSATIAMHPGPEVRVTFGARVWAHEYAAMYQAEAAFFALVKCEDIAVGVAEYAFREG